MMNYADIRKKALLHALSNKDYSKLFGIGFNKTGTTSLELIFKVLGLKVPIQQEQELRIVKQLYSGNFQPLVEFVGQYDAFQDKPFSEGVVYAQVDALFPKSKFILTVRDPEQWFDSLCRYTCQKFGVNSVKEIGRDFLKDKTIYLYKNYTYESFRRRILQVRDYQVHENWDLHYDKDHYIKLYASRNDAIIKYFDGREEDLLVIDVTMERDISKILDFLKLPRELNFPMPHLNRSLPA